MLRGFRFDLPSIFLKVLPRHFSYVCAYTRSKAPMTRDVSSACNRPSSGASTTETCTHLFLSCIYRTQLFHKESMVSSLHSRPGNPHAVNASPLARALFHFRLSARS